jgi:hypothetical protein
MALYRYFLPKNVETEKQKIYKMHGINYNSIFFVK